MKNLLRSMSLLCVLGSGAAVAQSPIVNEAVSPANFSYTLYMQDRFALSDTSKGTSVENFSEVARFGLNYNYKRISSTILLQFDGGTAAGTNSVTSIRKGNVAYDLIRSNEHSLKVGIGREHLTSSVIYAPDAFLFLYGTNMYNQNTGQDGIDLYYTNKSEAAKITLGAGIFNNLGVRTFASNGYLSNTSPLVLTDNGTKFGAAAFNNSRAYVLQAKGEVPVAQGNVVANALYAIQANAPMDTAALATRDINYLEASVGYELSNKTGQVGAWYQTETFSSAQIQSPTTQPSGSNFNYVGVVGSSAYTQNVYGIGFTGNSGFFGSSNFTGDGVNDAATFGLAYEHFDNALNASFSPTSSTPAVPSSYIDPLTAAATSNIDAVNASVGYKYSTLNFALNYVYMTSSSSIFYGADVNSANLGTNASLVYVTGIVSL